MGREAILSKYNNDFIVKLVSIFVDIEDVERA